MKKNFIFATLLLTCTVTAYIAGYNLDRDLRYSPDRYQIDTLTEWSLLKLAIIQTESQFNSRAIGTKQDRGLFQITPIYIKEVNRLLGEEKYSPEDAFNPDKSLEMFEIYQRFKNPTKDIDLAIKLHNPGAGKWYSKKVKANLEYLKMYEYIREKV